MAKVVMRMVQNEKSIETPVGTVTGPMFGYCIESDSYEEALAKANGMLKKDVGDWAVEQYVEMIREQLRY